MQQEYNGKNKKPYITLLLVTAIVYFFLAVIWKYFAPFIVAFLFLLAVEPILDKWSSKVRIGRKALAYMFILFILGSISLSVYFGLIPYIQRCDLSWCMKLLEQPWIKQILIRIQESGLGTIAEWSGTIMKWGSDLCFQIGAYGLSIFLLSGVFRKLKSNLEKQKEGLILLTISKDIISYLKGYLKTQGKLFLIMCLLCIPTLTFSGIKGGWILGILAGVLDFFPVFGTGIVLVPTALWQFMEKDYMTGIICAVLFIVCAAVREVLEPKFLGHAIKLPSIGIWISIYAGIQIFGASGIFKGPIGYLLITTIYRRITNREETAKNT